MVVLYMSEGSATIHRNYSYLPTCLLNAMFVLFPSQRDNGHVFAGSFSRQYLKRFWSNFQYLVGLVISVKQQSCNIQLNCMFSIALLVLTISL